MTVRLSVLAKVGEKLEAVEKRKTGRRGEGEANCSEVIEEEEGKIEE